MNKIDKGLIVVNLLDEITIQRQVELFNGAFNEDKTIEYWRNRYFSSTGNKKMKLFGAYYEGVLIGINGFMEFKFCLGGKQFRAIQSGDSAVDFEFRGNGVFKAIIKRAEEFFLKEGYDFIFGFPDILSYSEFLKLGWVKVKETKMLSIPGSIKSFVENHYQCKLPKAADLLLEIFWIKIRTHCKKAKDIEVRVFDTFPFSPDELLKVGYVTGEIMTIKSPEMIKQKVDSKRSISYYLIYEKGEFVAYFMTEYSFSQRIGEYIEISDWWAINHKENILRNIIAHRMLMLKKMSYTIGVPAPTAPKYRGIFRALGFLRLGKSKIPLLVMPLNCKSIVTYFKLHDYEIKAIDIF